MKPNWQKKEASDSKVFETRLNKGSGKFWYNPSDSKNDTWLIESKQTDKKSYSVSLMRWDKIAREALMSFRLPILSVRIKDTDLVVVSRDDFLKLIEKSKDV